MVNTFPSKGKEVVNGKKNNIINKNYSERKALNFGSIFQMRLALVERNDISKKVTKRGAEVGALKMLYRDEETQIQDYREGFRLIWLGIQLQWIKRKILVFSGIFGDHQRQRSVVANDRASRGGQLTMQRPLAVFQRLFIRNIDVDKCYSNIRNIY